ncbi:hypothetical protein GP2_024_00850 [Gordonia paraffinivorans NBRC 108238]|uniref:GAF domain-containing protein n=1 Tax=Gordonia paraffinivorans NBRC 108238 TaxID=1223543 RepID=A0ABQ0IM81_9ACTN|nr:hypothetical protein GP2_024_00850 [Gordonia paraffinivorans NBRC 108238]
MPEVQLLQEPQDAFASRISGVTDRIFHDRNESLKNGAALGSATIESYRRRITELTDQLPADFHDDLHRSLTGLHQEWQLAVTQDWEMNSRVTRDMDDAALELSGLERTEYLEQVPRIVGEICGFQKVLFSVVQGTHWIPVSMWAKDPTEITAIRLNDYLKDNPVIRLVGSLPEAEMARNRRPVLIENALENPRTHKPPVVLSNATDYAGAPLFVDGRIAAFLHIDRAIQSRPPNETDMLWLNRYSTSVAAMYRIQRTTKKERRLRNEMPPGSRPCSTLRQLQVRRTFRVPMPRRGATASSSAARPSNARG